MSELTLCNHCRYKRILARAAASGSSVKLKPQDGGQAVYVDGEWWCWFMELTEGCCC